jgi:heterodisulfide reductase subunit A-like polyferredoxin
MVVGAVIIALPKNRLGAWVLTKKAFFARLNYLVARTAKDDERSFLIDSAPIKRFPRLKKNTNVDAVVIGAGVTGITTAYLLKKAGLTVALIERERVASIDTGHTTAHLTYVTDVELQELADNFGNDHAQAACKRNRCDAESV